MIPIAGRSSPAGWGVVAALALMFSSTTVLAATEPAPGRITGTATQRVLTHGHGRQVSIVMRAAGGTGGAPAPATSLGTLPATFAGLLPCADCNGVRYQINLLPGGGYMQRATHLRAGRDESTYELGAWSLSSDGRTLTLDGGRRGRASWGVRDSRTLRPLDPAGNAIPSKPPQELTRAAGVQPMEPRTRLEGMFRTLAAAGRFRDCLSGLEWPVEMSADYAALERAYTERRESSGDELKVMLEGRIEQRPKLEGDRAEPTLIVEEFLSVVPGTSCGERYRDIGLEHNRWRPIEIGDQPVTVSDGQREPWIVLDPREKRITGSGGCNRISGSYETSAGKLRFSQVVSTMMACPSMATETAFLRALEATRRYRASGRTLELMDQAGKVLVRLEERNL